MAETEMVERGWQPIETAPRDGTEILAAWGNGDIRIGYWYGPNWADTSPDGMGYINPPAYWMPLPDPPALRADRPA